MRDDLVAIVKRQAGSDGHRVHQPEPHRPRPGPRGLHPQACRKGVRESEQARSQPACPTRARYWWPSRRSRRYLARASGGGVRPCGCPAEVEKALNRLSRAPVLTRVVFDLSAVSFLDVAGLRTVLRADARGRVAELEVVVVQRAAQPAGSSRSRAWASSSTLSTSRRQRDNHDRCQGGPPAPTSSTSAGSRHYFVKCPCERGCLRTRLPRPGFQRPRQTRLTGGTPTESGRRMPSVMAHSRFG